MAKKLIAVAAMALLLTGCASSAQNTAQSACVEEAEAEIGSPIDVSGLSTANMSEALYEAEITDERDTTGKNDLYTVSGDITYTDGDVEKRMVMVCTVTFKDGAVDETNLTLG